MWSEESRAIGTRVDSDAGGERRRRENDVQSSTTTVGRKIRGGSEKPGNETARFLAQWAREVHQHVVTELEKGEPNVGVTCKKKRGA